MRRVMLVLAAGLLAGCGTVQPEKVVTVKVEVAVPCLKAEDVPAKPVYVFGKGDRPASGVTKAQLLAQDLEQAELYGVKWEAAAAGCLVLSGKPQPAAPSSPGSSHRP